MKNKTAILISSAILSLGAVITLAATSSIDDWLISGGSMYATSTVNFVGIGTASPTAPLDIVGSGASIVRVKSTDNFPYFELIDSTGYINSISQAGGELYFGSGHTSNYGINFRNGWNINMKLTSDGDLGIGTTTPSSILHVVEQNATTTVTIGGNNSPACFKTRDMDNAGWTYCSFLNGTMACSMTSCE